MSEIVFDELGAAPIILALLYIYVLIIASSRLANLRIGLSSDLNTEKLFVMTLLLACVTRIMGFVSIGVLNLQSISIGYDGHQQNENDDYIEDSDQIFYEKCILVLFDFPDFITLSAYTLLAVVWAESFLQSRRHWLSSRHYRRSFLISYLIFNACLYLSQILLYGMLFLPTAPTAWAGHTLYTVLTTINFGLPVLLLSYFIYLSVSFSGFPFRSALALRRQSLVRRALLVWTFGRVCWGVFALTAALQYSLATSSAAEESEIYSVLVVFLFLITELYPFIVALDKDVLSVLGDESVDVPNTPVKRNWDEDSPLCNLAANDTLEVVQKLRLPSS